MIGYGETITSKSYPCTSFCWGGNSGSPIGQSDFAGFSSPALDLLTPEGLLSFVIALLSEDSENGAVSAGPFHYAFTTIATSGSFYGGRVISLVAGVL